MDDLGVIDRFLQVFSQYIDSGFGLLGGDVAFLTAALIVIDVTLAGLFWAMGGDDVLGKLIRKILYVGAFAFIITNFNWLAGILFNSFAGLGLVASGSDLSQAELLMPGRVASVGVEAGGAIMDQIGELTGFRRVFFNLDTIVVLFFAWMIVVFSFFILSIQLFVTLIEFKLTTLAGFVLVPFALWNKTAFLAERVLGNVMASGIKVLVLAVIVGIGSGIFEEFLVPPGEEPSLEHAMTIMLASLALLGLGIFGPGIATGLVSGAPQLGAGSAAGTALGAGGIAVAGGSAVAAGARLVPQTTRAASDGARSMGSAVKSAGAAYRSGADASSGGRLRAAGAGLVNVTRHGAAKAGERLAAGARAMKDTFVGSGSAISASDSVAGAGVSSPGAADGPPDWARRLERKQRRAHAVSTTAHVLRSSDHGGSGASPSLRDDSEK